MKNVTINKVELRGRIGTVRVQAIGDRLVANFSLCTEKHYQDKNRFSYHINGNETPIRFDKIEDELIELLQSEEDPTFSIYADETVPIKEVVAVMNIAKRNHYKVIMATSPE